MSETSLEFIGPFDEYVVVMDGRRVPFLNGRKLPDGSVDLTLDRRFALHVKVEDVLPTVWFIANAIAVGLGYACHQSADMEGPIPRNPFGGVVHAVTINPPPLSVVPSPEEPPTP